MRVLLVFLKNMKEQSRDLLMLGLTLIFAPLFVFLYWMFFPGGSTTFDVLVLDHDVPAVMADRTTLSASKDVQRALESITYADGEGILNVELVVDQDEAEERLKNHSAEVLLIIPEEFSSTIAARRLGSDQASASVKLVGDLTNPYYAIAAVMVGSAVEGYGMDVAGLTGPVQFEELALGASVARSEFDLYVPGLMIFAVIMLIFLAAMAVTHELEAGTLRRLQLTPMNAFDFLGGTCAGLIVIAVAQVVLTFLTAQALGFESQGPMWVAILVGVVTSFSIIGTGMIVASLSKSVSQAFIIANFPLALFMFFTNAVFPIQKVPLFEIAGRTISLWDFLPPTHAVVALNKVLTIGAGLEDVLYELVALILLSFIYLSAGLWIFDRTKMQMG
jgi:ABC-2 type transport system permease protein